ncbi:hypothetical protein L7F22_034575 [Adiantum nelumboides]|nr:hypothetical protein [Adiantum nelumboides]
MGEPSTSWQNFNFRDDDGSAQGMQALRLLLAKLQEAQANPHLKPSVSNLLMTQDLTLTSARRPPAHMQTPHMDTILEGTHEGQESLNDHEHMNVQETEQPLEEGEIRHEDGDKDPPRGRKRKRSEERLAKGRRRRHSSSGS